MLTIDILVYPARWWVDWHYMWSHYDLYVKPSGYLLVMHPVDFNRVPWPKR